MEGDVQPNNPVAPALPLAMTSDTSSSPPYQLDAQEVARSFDVQVDQGLSTTEARKRLAQDGPNELLAQPPIPAWRHFLPQFQDPLVYLLLLAVAITFSVWALEGWVGWPVDALVILVVVLLNAVMGFAQENRSQKAAAALARLTTVTSAVLRDGVPLRFASAELVRGDVLLLSEGDHVGADARLLQANTLRVQEASLVSLKRTVTHGTHDKTAQRRSR